MAPISNADVIQQWSDVPRAVVEAFGEEGDVARQTLLNPTLFALIGDVAGKDVLDVGCGQGYLARLLAQRGARVTGIEPATPFIAYARECEHATPLGIQYLQADITTLAHHLPTFDLVIANMVLMDIPDYLAALDVCLGAMRPGGHFVFAIIHPCFEGEDRDYEVHGSLTVTEYFAEYAIAQRWGYRFHRPLSHYLNACIQRGGTIDAVVEPQLETLPESAPSLLARHQHVPGFIVVRVRK